MKDFKSEFLIYLSLFIKITYLYIIKPIFSCIHFLLIKLIGGGLWFYVSMLLIIYFILEHSLLLYDNTPIGITSLLATQPVLFSYVFPPIAILFVYSLFGLILFSMIIRQINALWHIIIYKLPRMIMDKILIAYYILFQFWGDKSHPSIIQSKEADSKNIKFILILLFLFGLVTVGAYIDYTSNNNFSKQDIYGNFSYDNATYITYENGTSVQKIKPVIIKGNKGYYMNVTAIIVNSVIYIENELEYYYQLNKTNNKL